MKRLRWRYGCYLLALGGVLLPVLLGWYVWRIEPRWLQVRRVTLPVAGLPPELDGVTILQLSDLHRGPQVSAADVRRVVRLAARYPADLILLTGDYVTGDAQLADEVARELASLTAPYGLYAVTGNHDAWTDADRVAAALEAQGIRVLRDEAVVVEVRGVSLALVGLDDTGWVESLACPEPPSAWQTSLDTLATLTADLPEGAPRLLLLHNPDLAQWIPAGQVQAVLSGHTHGGQIRLPFLGTPVLPSCHGARYAAGLAWTPAGIPVYISRGTGTAILPLRLGVRPEITLLQLKSWSEENYP